MSRRPGSFLAALAALAVLVPDLLRADDRGPLRAGVDLQVHLHEEAGGNRSVLPALGLHAGLALDPRLALTVAYGFSTPGPAGGRASALTLLHRASLRAEFALPVGPNALLLGLGPGVLLTQTTLYDAGRPVVSTALARPGLNALAAFEARLGSVSIRTGFELLWTAARLDLVGGIGAEWAFGGGP